MVDHLTPRYGPHTAQLILTQRPQALPGVFALAVAEPFVASLCDWFLLDVERDWHTLFSPQDWVSFATGGWYDEEPAATWTSQAGAASFTSPATGGWYDEAVLAGWRAATGASGFTSPTAGGWRSSATGDWHTDAAGGWRGRKPCA